jgi:hypothetical protein
MPKPFTAFVEIEQAYVGQVLMRLKGMRGVVGVGFDDGKKSKSNGHDVGEPVVHRARGPYKKYETTGADELIKILHGKPPMTSTQLADAFRARGRSPKSINSLCHSMKKSGDLVLTEDGYTLSKKMRDRLRHRVAAKKTRR